MSSSRVCVSDAKLRGKKPGERSVSRKWLAVLAGAAVYAVAIGCSTYLDNPALASSKGSGEGGDKSASDVVSLASGASVSCDEQGLQFELEICNTGLDDLEQVVINHKLPAGFSLLMGSIVAVDAAGDPIDARVCNDQDDDGDDDGAANDDDGDDDGDHAGDDNEDDDSDDDVANDNGDDSGDGDRASDDDGDDDGDHAGDDDDGDDDDHHAADDGDDDGDHASDDDDGDHHAADDDGRDNDDDAADDDEGSEDDDEHGDSEGVEICLDSPIPPGACVVVTFVATVGDVWSEVEVHAKTGDGESDEDGVEVAIESNIGGALNDLLATACEPCESGPPAAGDLAAFCGLSPDECDPLTLFGCVDAVDVAVNDLLDGKCASCCPDDPTCACIFGGG